jgi:hypothetical protein
LGRESRTVLASSRGTDGAVKGTPASGKTMSMDVERQLDDPLKLIEHVLGVLRNDVDRDAAIERLIHDLEDERALLIATWLRRE